MHRSLVRCSLIQLSALDGAEFDGRPLRAALRGPRALPPLAPLPTTPPADGLTDSFSKLRRGLQVWACAYAFASSSWALLRFL